MTGEGPVAMKHLCTDAGKNVSSLQENHDEILLYVEESEFALGRTIVTWCDGTDGASLGALGLAC